MRRNRKFNFDRPYIIGLTGTIASGKSVCSDIFKNFGIPVIDADKIAYKVVEPGAEGLKAIEEEFGPEYVLPDGSYNRDLMRETVINDRNALEKLNEILHPIIKKEKDEQIRALKDEKVIVYDCPLLFESNENRMVDDILMVTVDDKTRLERLKERNSMTEKEALDMISLQPGEDEKIRRSNTIIYNNGTIEDLELVLKDYLKEIFQRVNKKRKK